jgi:hypothetical protein
MVVVPEKIAVIAYFFVRVVSAATRPATAMERRPVDA